MWAAIRARRSRTCSTCMVEAQDLLAELGVHLETCTNEAAAAAMLGASINYPLRGAVTWKSTVGTNIASDALANLASAGVMGGALIVLGEDYGEGASIMQERTHAFAMKSSMWLLDPRPDLPTIVRMVGDGLRAVGGEPRPGDAGAAHPRLPRHRRVRRQGQSPRRPFRPQSPARPAGASTTAGSRIRRSPSCRSACKVEDRLPAAHAFIARAQAQRAHRPAISTTSASW